MANFLEENLFEANLFDAPDDEQQLNEGLIERVENLSIDISNNRIQDLSDNLIFDFLKQLSDTIERPQCECYICGNSGASNVRELQCGHALCLDCIQSQAEHLPKPGDQFLTRNAKCGICSSWIVYEDAPKEFSVVKEREDALLERLKADKDPDPELHELLATGALLSKWQFMICLYVHRSCFAWR
jgi:hypothetical protein